MHDGLDNVKLSRPSCTSSAGNARIICEGVHARVTAYSLCVSIRLVCVVDNQAQFQRAVRQKDAFFITCLACFQWNFIPIINMTILVVGCEIVSLM